MGKVEHIIATQFKKGQSGNPSGRKKGSKNLTTILRAMLEEEIDYKDPFTKKKVKGKIKNVLNLRLIHNAIARGNDRSIEHIYDRIEGKPLEQHLHRDIEIGAKLPAEMTEDDF